MVKLLVVDDEAGVRDLLYNYFTDLNYDVISARDGEEALRFFNELKPHLILLDYNLPYKTGIDVLKEIKSTDSTAKVIMITGIENQEIQRQAADYGVNDFVKKPFRLDYLEKEVLPKIGMQLFEDLRKENIEKARLNYELKQKLEEIEVLYQKLKQTSLQTIMSLALALESKDPYTHGHSKRVAEYSLGIALMLKSKDGWCVDEKFISNIEREALLHDIGKVGMPDSILRKTEKLTPEEYELIKAHPEIGAKILQPIEDLRENVEVILHHHESFNGDGYPDGLKGVDVDIMPALAGMSGSNTIVEGANRTDIIKGKSIPERARILSVADAYDAMTSGRNYRKPLSSEEALSEIKRCSGSQFDPEIVQAFEEFLKHSQKI